MLRPNENKNAPQGNVAQGRGGVVGRKTGGRWSEDICAKDVPEM